MKMNQLCIMILVLNIYFITINIFNNKLSNSVFLSTIWFNKKINFNFSHIFIDWDNKNDFIALNLLIDPMAVDNEIV